MGGLEAAGELFVRLVTHPLAWRGFAAFAAYVALAALAFWRGGWPERLGSGGALLHAFVPYAITFAGLAWPGLSKPAAHVGSDLAFLLIYLPLVIASSKRWPLWFFAFNLMCPLSFAAAFLSGLGLAPLYVASWIWVACQIGALAVGVVGEALRRTATDRAAQAASAVA